MRLAYGLYAWLAFAVITLPTIGLLALTPGTPRRRRLVRAAAQLVLRVIGARPAVTGLEQLPDEACIVVANHASYMDGMLLTAVLPPRFSFVIKREMSRVPLAGFLLRRIGSEFVERSDSKRGARDLRRILESAGQQQSLVFFPEGTFTEKPGLRRFHNGAFATAARAGLSTVPVVIRGTRHMLACDRLLPQPAAISVIIKEPVPCPDGPEAAEQIMQRCRASIAADVDEPDLAT